MTFYFPVKIAGRLPGATQHIRSRVSNLPNFITLGRVILVPIVFWLLLNGEMQLAFVLFVIAGLSDGVDGYLAKRFGWTSELGAYLDPLADKLLLVCIFIALGVAGHLPSWLVIAVVTRDMLIVIGVVLSWLLANPVHIHPLVVSKFNTLAQIILATLVMADEGFALGLGLLRAVLIWVTAALIITSLAAYARTWLMHMTGYDSAPPPG
jgi:cardiolipin synthase